MKRRSGLLILTLICSLFLLNVESQAQIKPISLPVPSDIAETIRDSAEEEEISDFIHERKWKDALILCRRVLRDATEKVQILDEWSNIETQPINEWKWRAMIGELYLLDLQPKAAMIQFDSIRRSLPAIKWKHNNSPEQMEQYRLRLRAGRGLARAYAELGKWPQSLNWFEQSYKEDLQTQWCGTCMDELISETYPTRVVWKKASYSPEQAILELQKIINGNFKPMKMQMNPRSDSYQKQQATQEAALILGEIYLRQGKRQEAQLLFQKVCARKSPSQQTYLAITYLDRMKKTPSI